VPRKTILIVDDEQDLVELIVFNLQREGYRTLSAYDGATGYDLAQQHIPDLILLDLMLPEKSGQEVAVALKAERGTARIPIIMLTAKSEESDVIVGLTLGADDYVTKPFSIKILLARIEAVLRRAANASPPADLLTAGDLEIDRSKHRVALGGQPVRLTLTEFKLLEALVGANGRVLSRDRLMDTALGADAVVTDRTIDVHITGLRKKLRKHRDLIETVRGVGYRLSESAGESEEGGDDTR
jgi:two-component system phosphate regulon response regulator PhoB